jgi:hypothetical protein
MINTMPTAKNRENISPLKYRSKKSMRATATPPPTSHEKNLARFHTWCERNVVPYPQRSIGNEEKRTMMRILKSVSSIEGLDGFVLPLKRGSERGLHYWNSFFV